MKAKISKIVLWPKRADKLPRIINFEMIGVEVITGRSQTGKSALISIVDYCLGSGKCAIPVGETRTHAEWFGVVIRMPNAEMLIARRNPGLQAQTTETYFDMGTRVTVPETLSDLPKTNTTAVLAKLDQLAQLPSLSLTGGDESGFMGRPSFRDTAAFQFQPQHIVANPYTLFFKADTFEHQEKLKNIFPLVLGAIDAATLEHRRNLRLLERELRNARDLLEHRRQRAATWTQEFRGFYLRARELGLLPDSPDPTENWTTELFVGHLTPVPARLRQNPFPVIERGASRRLARETAELQNSERSIARTIEDRKRKVSRVDRLRSSTDGYSQALTLQGERLQPVSWFEQHLEQNPTCPVCGAESVEAANEVKRLVELAKQVAANVGSVETVSHVLDKESAALAEELQNLEAEVNAIRSQMAQLEQESDEVRRQRQTITEIHNFAGRLEQELQKFTAADQGTSLVSQVADLERRVSDLRVQLDQGSVIRRQNNALTTISEGIRHYAEIIGVEHFERPVRIDIKNLTLTISGPEGRRDHLWEIGSAANWMGLHVAALLALHEYFLSLTDRASPVPQFLFIDQPSQAFFPEKMNTDYELEYELEQASDDVARVRRIFRALSEAITRTQKRLQIVVIDHVGEAYWANIPDIHVVERWRGNDALIPPDWQS